MKLEAIVCNQCGAPLRLPREARYVTCRHCSASLAVRRSEDVTWTELLSQLDDRTERLERQVLNLEIERDLARLEDERRKTQDEFSLTGRNGEKHLPESEFACWIKGALFPAAGVVFGIAAGSLGVGVALGFLGLVAGLLYAGVGIVRRRGYELAMRRFALRRRQILQRGTSAQRTAEV